MAATDYYITAGLPPNDTADDGATKFYICAGFPPVTTAPGGAVAPTSVLDGPLCGPLDGPI